MEYQHGAIYADADGCLYNYAEPVFFAFGTSNSFTVGELTGRDEPTILVFDVNGNIHIDKLEYPNGTNLME